MPRPADRSTFRYLVGSVEGFSREAAYAQRFYDQNDMVSTIDHLKNLSEFCREIATRCDEVVTELQAETKRLDEIKRQVLYGPDSPGVL